MTKITSSFHVQNITPQYKKHLEILYLLMKVKIFYNMPLFTQNLSFQKLFDYA